MEKRDFWCLPLSIYNDDIFGITYVRVISQTNFESLKIPTTLEKFKSQHVLNPTNLLHVETIKTRKNWILKSVLSYKKIVAPKAYSDFLKHSQMINILIKHQYEDQETTLLRPLTKYLLSNPIEKIDIMEFESFVLSELGFK
jgi:hypothetical protein